MAPADSPAPSVAASTGPDGGLAPAHRRVLALCFFLSGAATLILEVVWAKELSYVLGNTTFAVGTVVGAFMTGLALGSGLAARLARRVRFPLLWYAGLEASIALCAFASVPVFRATAPMFRFLYRHFAGAGAETGSFFLLRFGLVFLLLLVPVTLMGMTLPVMIGAFGRNRERYNREAGTLYGLNTLGAVAGTVASGVLLIPLLGLLKTALSAGVLQLVVATVALSRHRQLGALPDLPADADTGKPRWTSTQWLIASVFLLSGAAAMIYEVAWFRLLTLVTGPSSAAFAVMLATFLVAVGLGSVMMGARVERLRDPLRAMGVLEALLGLAALLTMALYNHLPALHAAVLRGTTGSQATAQFFVAALVMLPPCFLMGMLFPVTVRALTASGTARAAPEHNVGRLYVFNTVGGIAGSLGASFWLVPAAGLQSALLATSFASVALGLILMVAARTPGFARAAAALAGGAVLIAVLLPAVATERLNLGLYMHRGHEPVASSAADVPRLLFHREGINTSVSVYRTPGNADLRVAGKVDASNSPLDLRTQMFVGQLPVLLSKHPRRVAVIGYGSGMSAGAALLQREVESLDVLEIEQGVIDASDYFSGVNGDPLRDPRTHLILEDGRTFLSYTDRQYDVIASEPSNPWIAGVGNLFTTDFYRIVRQRLTPDGVFGQWIQLYGISEEVFQGMLATLQEVFPHVVLFAPEPTDLVAVASAQPITLPWSTFRDRFAQPRARAFGDRLGLRHPADVLAHFAAGPEQTRALTHGSLQRNTDDNTWLERRLARDLANQRAGVIDLPWRETITQQRLPALRQLFPGLPVSEVATEIVRYLHDMEPTFTADRRVADTWEPHREPIALGLVEGLRALGLPDDARRLQEFAAQTREQWKARLSGTETLLEVMGDMAAGKPINARVVREIVAKSPELPAALWVMGKIESGTGNTAQAEALYRKAMESPWHRVTYDAAFSLAGLLARTERAAEAETLMTAVLARNPYWAQPYTILATLAQRKGDLARARAVIADGLRRNPDEPSLVALRDKLAGP